MIRAFKYVTFALVEDHFRLGWLVSFPNDVHRHQIYGIEMCWICDCKIYRRINGKWAKEHGRDPDRWAKMEEGARFFNLFRDATHIPRRAIENSIPHGHAVKLIGRGPDQYTQPWWFGDAFTKAAGWWLYGLPPLVREFEKSDYPEIKPKCWLMGPSEDREEKRSETEPGLGRAIAQQWASGLFIRPPPLHLGEMAGEPRQP